MKRIICHTLFGILVLALGALFVACENTTTDPGGAGIVIAEVTVLDAPQSGTRLPEIGEAVSHSLSYTITDDYYSPGNTYRITAYFRASDSLVQVYQTTVAEQSEDSVDTSFEIPSGFPVTPTIESPYRLYYELTDETNGILVLADSADLIYEDWVFTGTWYGIDSKSETTNTGFEVTQYDFALGGYLENDMRGTLVNKAGNAAEMTFTEYWNGSSWVVDPDPQSGTIYYFPAGDTITYAGDSAGTEIFQILSAQPTSYDEAYAGKWWTGAVQKEVDDNGIIIFFSDDEFEILRDEQNDYPLVERGTVSKSGNTITLTVTHLPAGTPGFFTPVNPNDPVIQYTMTYTVIADTLTLTGTGGGDYAGSDGIGYVRTE